MKCARLRLQERSKLKSKSDNSTSIDKPRRYCQKRLVNPEHEEDPRWTDVLERFHCKTDIGHKELNMTEAHQDNEDMFLTVQTLQFKGDADQDQVKRPRTSFKYKTVTDGNKHRMFVKQPVTDTDVHDDDRSSQLTCYFDDYVQYLFNNDRSRPTSGKSGIYLRGVSADLKENKSTQVHIAEKTENKRPRDLDPKVMKISPETELKDDTGNVSESIEAKIRFKKSGKRKSLTISRAQSPETVQVIRVDVVCNYASSVASNHEDRKIASGTNSPDRRLENISVKNSHFANKYLLTNTIKTLDENLSGGAKVTLLCKTFKLSDRSKFERPKIGIETRQHTTTLKDVTRNYIQVKTQKQWMK